MHVDVIAALLAPHLVTPVGHGSGQRLVGFCAGQLGQTASVQVNRIGGVEALVNDVLHDSETLASDQLSLEPTIDREAAERRAVQWMKEQYPQPRFDDVIPAELVIYSPTVVGRTGEAQLAWRTAVGSEGDPSARELVLINAHTGDVAFHHTLVYHSLKREVYDYVDNETRIDPDQEAKRVTS